MKTYSDSSSQISRTITSKNNSSKQLSINEYLQSDKLHKVNKYKFKSNVIQMELPQQDFDALTDMFEVLEEKKKKNEVIDANLIYTLLTQCGSIEYFSDSEKLPEIAVSYSSSGYSYSTDPQIIPQETQSSKITDALLGEPQNEQMIKIEMDKRIVVNVTKRLDAYKIYNNLYQLRSFRQGYFSFKVLTSLGSCSVNLEKIVIYYNSKYVDDALKGEIIKTIQQPGVVFDDILPVFINPIASGIGEGDGSQSFSAERATIVLLAYKKSKSVSEFIKNVELELEKCGYNAHEPYRKKQVK